MKKCLFCVAAFTAATLCSSMAFAENRAETFAITPFIGGYHFDGVQNIGAGPIYGLKTGYNFTNRLGLDGIVEGGKSEGDGVSLLNYRLEALYNMFPGNRLVPYLAAGYGGMRVTDYSRDLRSGFFDYGVGAKYFLNDNIALRGDVRHLIIDCGPTYSNYEYTLGLSFIFGGAKPAPKVVQAVQAPKAAEATPVVVQSPKAPAPSSNLTVSPTTIVKGQTAILNWASQNTTVCNIQPGIGSVQTSGSMSVTPVAASNYTLSCTGQGGTTSSNAGLNVTPPAPKPSEIPIVLDTDKDGVTDNLDKCPNTPLGLKVDKDGCPIDSDRDGVADYLDKCPNTPLGVTVDNIGCPTDSDKDGVPDYLDKCPTTPLGDKVDANGCTIPVEPPCQSIKLNVEFDTSKADIKPAYHDELKKVGDMLNKYPMASAEIEGHTDNIGSATANLKLSEQRANSVRKYIIDNFGINADRIIAKGYGLAKPIATNNSAEGRKENRRVNAVLSCGGN